MFMQRRSHFDKSEKWAYFVSWCVVGSPSFLRGTTRGLFRHQCVISILFNIYLIHFLPPPPPHSLTYDLPPFFVTPSPRYRD
jgi:hypothetical protein